MNRGEDKIKFFKGKPMLTLDQLVLKEQDPKEFQRRYGPKIIEKDDDKDRKKPKRSKNEDKKERKSEGKSERKSNSSNKKQLTMKEKMAMFEQRKRVQLGLAKPRPLMKQTTINWEKKSTSSKSNISNKTNNNNNKYENENYINKNYNNSKNNKKEEFIDIKEDSSEDYGYAQMMFEEEELDRKGKLEDKLEKEKLKKRKLKDSSDDDDY